MTDHLSPAAQFAQAALEAQAEVTSAVESLAVADSAQDDPALFAKEPVREKPVSPWPAAPSASATAAATAAAAAATAATSTAPTVPAPEPVAEPTLLESPSAPASESQPPAAVAIAEHPASAASSGPAAAFAATVAAAHSEPFTVPSTVAPDVSPAAAFEAAASSAAFEAIASAAAAAVADIPSVDSAVASNSGDDDIDDDDVATSASKPAKPAPRPIDLADESLFPSLGRPATSASAGGAWGAKSGAALKAALPSMVQQIKRSQTTEIVDLPIMQDPVSGIVLKIMERTKTRIDVSHNRVLNTSTYLISGKPDAVAKAKREVCTKLSPRITKVLQIPAIARAQVAGVRGKTLQTIQTQTSTTISLAKPSDHASSGDSFEQIDVTIAGSHTGVAAAIAQIDALVDKRTTKRVVRLADLPHEANAMLVGKGGAALRALQASHPAVQIRIPGPLDADQSIAVLGERADAENAAAEIAAAARALIQVSQVASISIPKRQHRFIIGQGGSTIREIIEATGCSVSVPAPRNPSDVVTLRGPEPDLIQALSLVMSKANSVTVQVVDPTSIHKYSRPLLYAQRVLRYLHDRNRFRRIESEHGVELQVPTPAQIQAATLPAHVQVEVHGKDANAVSAACKALTSLIAAFPPYHFNSIEVEPHLHALLAGPDGSSLARLQTVRSIYTLFPKDKASSTVTIVYEGFNPDVDRLATPAEREGATRELLRKTLEEFRTTVQTDNTYVTRTVPILASFQAALAKPAAVDDVLAKTDALADGGRVTLRFGSLDAPADFAGTHVDRKKGDAQLQPDEVEVKGLATSVDRVIAELLRRVEDVVERERLNSFRAEVSVPQSLMARVIGRGGENIKRLQTEHGVSVDVVDASGIVPGTVKLKGTQEGIAAARDELLAFVERMADQTSETITVAANIHRTLIGTGGRFVKRLEDKYAVRITFPSSSARPSGRDRDASGSEGSASGGAPGSAADAAAATAAAPLSPDQILIRGGRKGVDAAKAELLELAAYELEHNHTVQFKVPASALPHIVGRAGVHINEIKDESDTRIDLGDPSDGGEVEVAIVGTRAGTKLAREAIEATVLEQQSQIDVTVAVPAKHHRFLIGAGGGRVRELVQQAGGDPDLMSGAKSCRVQFPRASSESTDEVKLKGDRAVVEAVRARIEELVAERERMTTILVAVPVSQHAFIIGRGGANLKQMQETHSVEIFFPRAASRGSAAAKGASPDAAATAADSANVRITGLLENCEACKAALLRLVREECSITVPLALHQRLGGRQGSLWRQVRAEFDVQVDTVRADKSPARRIDSSAASDSAAPGTVVYRDIDADLEGLTAEWILRGEKDKLAQAMESVRKHTANASSIEARISVEPRNHRHIIGKQGANIAKIRDMTGCEVVVPRKGNSSSWVTVTGDRASIPLALEMINQCIEERE
ncbi:hypothetical protein GGI07_003701 [Coemansia sp. Benny D115]|nr:hypothetical protein GGI07_003701 [Coemansia sp. Benny D115]